MPKNKITPTNIDYKQLGDTIAEALKRTDSRRKQEQINTDRKLEQERINADQKRQQQRQQIRFWHLLWLKKAEAQNLDVDAATAFVQALLETMFAAFEWALYIIAFISLCFLVPIIGSYKDNQVWISIALALGSLFCSCVAFTFARFFRLAKFEIEHMSDRQYLIGFFAALSSFFAMLFALISLAVSFKCAS